jgi:hypothetical protein
MPSTKASGSRESGPSSDNPSTSRAAWEWHTPRASLPFRNENQHCTNPTFIACSRRVEKRLAVFAEGDLLTVGVAAVLRRPGESLGLQVVHDRDERIRVVLEIDVQRQRGVEAPCRTGLQVATHRGTWWEQILVCLPGGRDRIELRAEVANASFATRYEASRDEQCRDRRSSHGPIYAANLPLYPRTAREREHTGVRVLSAPHVGALSPVTCSDRQRQRVRACTTTTTTTFTTTRPRFSAARRAKRASPRSPLNARRPERPSTRFGGNRPRAGREATEHGR